jgi:aminopeptidase N
MREFWKVAQGVLAGALLLGLSGPGAAAESATPVAGATCAAGSSSIGDAYFPLMGNGGYDALHYALDLDLDVADGRIRAGMATIDALALIELCAFNLDFRGLDIAAITVDGLPATFSRRGAELTVTPAQPLAPGQRFTVDITYSGKPLGMDAPTVGSLVLEVLGALSGVGQKPDPTEAEQYGSGWWDGRDAIFIAGEPRGSETWFPANAHPADKATYTLRLTVDEPFTVVANGLLVETSQQDGKVTTVWDSADPMATYLVTFHAGRLDMIERDGPHGIPLRLVFAEGVGQGQRAMFDRLPEMITYFETVFGPYPFAAAGGTVVDAPILFALETQTIPTYGSLPFMGSTALTVEERKSQDALVAHEMAHQWFGNTVSVLRWQDIWLNEGFASYAQALWIEHTEGVAARNRHIAQSYALHAALNPVQSPQAVASSSAADVLATYQRVSTRFLRSAVSERFVQRYLDGLGVTSLEGLAQIPAAEGLAQLAALGVDPELFPGVAVPTGDPGAPNLFSPLSVYDRGMLTLHALRLRVGDDAFFAILRTWPEQYRNGNATTDDFIALSEEISGQDLESFFQGWLYEIALPSLHPGEAVATPVATPAP